MSPERIARFWSKASRADGCLLWTGRLDPHGYGEFRLGSGRSGRRQTRLAHRVAYEIAKGPIPPGLCVCHSCDVRNCVEPAHLWLGTVADNNRDMVAKGRHRTGAKRARTLRSPATYITIPHKEHA